MARSAEELMITTSTQTDGAARVRVCVLASVLGERGRLVEIIGTVPLKRPGWSKQDGV